MQTNSLRARFDVLLKRHVPNLPDLPRSRMMVLCPFHADKTPSLSIDREKCVWHCFGCGLGGGVRDFARRAGEPWNYQETREQRAQRVALATARKAYSDWVKQRVSELLAELQQVQEELTVLLPIYQKSNWRSNEGFALLTSAISNRYDTLTEIEYSLDLLTLHEHKQTRLERWKAEERTRYGVAA